MGNWDDSYIGLCKKILSCGTRVSNRTGVDSVKLPAYHLEFDLSREFPILTTKQLFIRQAVLEMLWIYKVQSNDVRWLQERNVHIWDEWETDDDAVWRARQLVKGADGKSEYKQIEKQFPEEFAHTIGTAYGWIVRRYGLIDRLLDKLKNDPEDRRMVMSLWQDEYLPTAVLPSCVWSSEWDVTDGTLNAWVHQRSCDVPLGLPFNVTQYSVLLCMLSQVTGLKPGTLNWSIKDAHIYVNQIEPIKEQIARYDEKGSLPAPKLWLNPEVKDFYDFDDSAECRDVKLIGYEHMGKIAFPIAQ
ncbi:MAG: thymidylate synthase [Clostridia bacterium]|nr:thymidylate synthase [Clostridia bacterium]